MEFYTHVTLPGALKRPKLKVKSSGVISHRLNHCRSAPGRAGSDEVTVTAIPLASPSYPAAGLGEGLYISCCATVYLHFTFLLYPVTVYVEALPL